MSDGEIAQVVIGGLAVIAGFLIYRWQRQRKRLGVAVLTNRLVVARPSAFEVSVQHNGKEVAEPRLVVLRIANTGDVPIESADFERPLSISFPDCEVLSAQVTGVRPGDLTATFKTEGATVTLDPCLLNPADLIEVQCLIDGSVAAPRVECRVVGVQSVQQVKLAKETGGNVWRVSAFDVVMLSLGPVGFTGLAVGLLIAGEIPAGFFSVLGALGASWYGLRTLRRSRLWLALPASRGQ